VIALTETVKVTRKYQVTIPESVRSKLGVKIGDTLIVKSKDNQIIMESSKHISNPSDALWNLFGKSLDIDATKLVEESWTITDNSEPKKQARKSRRTPK
jgi:AbrB family looped-hinge helix DNA binding protein